jgi:hypothetical protein
MRKRLAKLGINPENNETREGDLNDEDVRPNG